MPCYISPLLVPYFVWGVCVCVCGGGGGGGGGGVCVCVWGGGGGVFIFMRYWSELSLDHVSAIHATWTNTDSSIKSPGTYFNISMVFYLKRTYFRVFPYHVHL